jgi:hypothetical protein
MNLSRTHPTRKNYSRCHTQDFAYFFGGWTTSLPNISHNLHATDDPHPYATDDPHPSAFDARLSVGLKMNLQMFGVKSGSGLDLERAKTPIWGFRSHP